MGRLSRVIQIKITAIDRERTLSGSSVDFDEFNMESPLVHHNVDLEKKGKIILKISLNYIFTVLHDQCISQNRMIENIYIFYSISFKENVWFT